MQGALSYFSFYLIPDQFNHKMIYACEYALIKVRERCDLKPMKMKIFFSCSIWWLSSGVFGKNQTTSDTLTQIGHCFANML